MEKEITADTLREWLEVGKEVNILDIRSTDEREEWHIPNSIHLDVYEELKNHNPKALNGIEFDKSTPVVTVCAGGNTSLIAAELLRQEGYEAYSLQKGMKGWNLAWNIAFLAFDKFEIIQFRRSGKGCLSYLIISHNEAMVVDASLPVEVYQKSITKRGLILKYAVDTHIHADHLSRTKELAGIYTIEPSVPANDKLTYPYLPISDGFNFSLGEIRIKAIHTPGHTFESTTFLVDGNVLLTGDTLFINGVGRPDLKSSHNEARKKSRMLFHSLKKLLELDHSILVMPGHTSSPIAFDQNFIQNSLAEILTNTTLLSQTEEVFVSMLLDRIPSSPANYLRIVEKNSSGDFSDVNPIELEAGANRCAIL